MRLSAIETRRRFAGSRCARLATVRPDGHPHLVVVTFALLPDTDRVAIAIDHKPKSTTRLARLTNIAADPRVSLLADHYDDTDWRRLWWARADGTAAILADSDAGDDPVDHLVAKYPQYREHRPTGPVIVVSVERWSGWAGNE